MFVTFSIVLIFATFTKYFVLFAVSTEEITECIFETVFVTRTRLVEFRI